LLAQLPSFVLILLIAAAALTITALIVTGTILIRRKKNKSRKLMRERLGASEIEMNHVVTNPI
jgi:uncharacterized iron-regulated membrane protein